MINILFEKLPDAVEVSGKFYDITTDFRDWISFFDMNADDSISKNQKIAMSMMWFTSDIPDNISEAYNALMKFALCEEIHFTNAEENSGSAKAPVFSWLYDCAYVLGAFRQVYGIDLIRTDDMHWWEFNALFEALPDDTPVKKRIGYRSINPAEIRDKERRKQIIKIKRATAFPHRPVSAEKTGDVFSSL